VPRNGSELVRGWKARCPAGCRGVCTPPANARVAQRPRRLPHVQMVDADPIRQSIASDASLRHVAHILLPLEPRQLRPSAPRSASGWTGCRRPRPGRPRARRLRRGEIRQQHRVSAEAKALFLLQDLQAAPVRSSSRSPGSLRKERPESPPPRRLSSIEIYSQMRIAHRNQGRLTLVIRFKTAHSHFTRSGRSMNESVVAKIDRRVTRFFLWSGDQKNQQVALFMFLIIFVFR
jgi:hypothetical protein